MLACLYAGAVWGLFWIPLRALEDAGLHGLWITVVYFLVPTIGLLPVTLWRWRHVRAGGIQLQLTALISGGALLLYSTSIVYTDVVRAILLFYLTPVWATILARIYLGDRIKMIRIIAMVLAIFGMLTIFGLGAQFPMPRNIGDWLGLAAGFVWAIAMVRIRQAEDHSAIELTVGFFIGRWFFPHLQRCCWRPATYLPWQKYRLHCPCCWSLCFCWCCPAPMLRSGGQNS